MIFHNHPETAPSRGLLALGNKQPMATSRELESGLTQHLLLRLFDYDKETGLLRRKDGSPAGTNPEKSYVRVSVGGKLYTAHRLIWMIVTGEWPADVVDHINGQTADNRWQNLRAATQKDNTRNSKAKRDGLKGAFKSSSKGKWMSTIQVDGTIHYLGKFETELEAHQAYVVASKKFFGEFSRAA